MLTLIKRRKTHHLLYGNRKVLHLNKLEFPSPEDASCQIWPSGSGEEHFKICQCIFTISKLSPLGKGWGPSFEQTWLPFTQGCIVPSLVEIGSVVLKKRIFKFLQFFFRYFVIICPWKRVGPSIWTNLNHHHLRMFVSNLVEIGSDVLEKKMKMCLRQRQRQRRRGQWRRTTDKLWSVLGSGELKNYLL